MGPRVHTAGWPRQGARGASWHQVATLVLCVASAAGASAAPPTLPRAVVSRPAESPCAREGAACYTEELLLRPLPDARVAADFEFTSRVRLRAGAGEAGTQGAGGSAWLSSHWDAFPKTLMRAVRAHGVEELRVTLGHGRWEYSRWGAPLTPAPPGAEVQLWLSDPPVRRRDTDAPVGDAARSVVERSDAAVAAVRNALSGIYCASINLQSPVQASSAGPASAATLASAASHATAPDRHAPRAPPSPVGTAGGGRKGLRFVQSSLPREASCTENLAPWLRMLPCRSRAGLSTLLNPLRVFGSRYHMFATRVRKVCDDIAHGNATGAGATAGCERQVLEVRHTLSTVLDTEASAAFGIGSLPQRLWPNTTSWSLESLFGGGRTLDGAGVCPAAHHTRVYVEVGAQHLEPSHVAAALSAARAAVAHQEPGGSCRAGGCGGGELGSEGLSGAGDAMAAVAMAPLAAATVDDAAHNATGAAGRRLVREASGLSLSPPPDFAVPYRLVDGDERGTATSWLAGYDVEARLARRRAATAGAVAVAGSDGAGAGAAGGAEGGQDLQFSLSLAPTGDGGGGGDDGGGGACGADAAAALTRARQRMRLPVSAQRFITGSGLTRRGITTWVTNLDGVPFEVQLVEVLPWWLRPRWHTHVLTTISARDSSTADAAIRSAEEWLREGDADVAGAGLGYVPVARSHLVRNYSLELNKYRGPPAVIETRLLLPAHTRVALSLSVDLAFLQAEEFPADPNHGFELPSAAVYVYIDGNRGLVAPEHASGGGVSGACEAPASMRVVGDGGGWSPLVPQGISDADLTVAMAAAADVRPGAFPAPRASAGRRVVTLYTESVIVDMPLPDFSMPYNVITVTSSVMAFTFGTLLNLLGRKSRAARAAAKAAQDKAAGKGKGKRGKGKGGAPPRGLARLKAAAARLCKRGGGGG